MFPYPHGFLKTAGGGGPSGPHSDYVSQGMVHNGSGYQQNVNQYTNFFTKITGVCVFRTTGTSGHLCGFWSSFFDELFQVRLSSGKIQVYSANGIVISDNTYNDGDPHSVWWQYTNGGAYEFLIDSQDEGVASTVPTANLDLGSGTYFQTGRSPSGSSYVSADTKVGFCGVANTIAPVWEDFFDNYGRPWEITTSGWPEWVVEPDWWCPDGDFSNNLGSNADSVTQTGVTGPSNFVWPSP
jgi:hypothetical protein